MSNEIVLSVIIPVFNGEKFIETSLRAILSELPAHSEVIAVDDGSTDQTFQILSLMALNVPMMKVLTRPNGRCGGARNTGLNVANGTYVFYCDGDDEVVGAGLTSALNMLDSTGADGCVSRVLVKRDNGTCLDVRIPLQFLAQKTKSGQDFYRESRKLDFKCTSTWTYVFRRDFLIKHALYFVENRFHEDLEYTNRVLAADPKICFNDTAHYIYCIRSDSIVAEFSQQRFDDLVYFGSLVQERSQSCQQSPVVDIWKMAAADIFYECMLLWNDAILSNASRDNLSCVANAAALVAREGRNFKIRIFGLMFRVSPAIALYFRNILLKSRGI